MRPKCDQSARERQLNLFHNLSSWTAGLGFTLGRPAKAVKPNDIRSEPARRSALSTPSQQTRPPSPNVGLADGKVAAVGGRF